VPFVGEIQLLFIIKRRFKRFVLHFSVKKNECATKIIRINAALGGCNEIDKIPAICGLGWIM